MNDGQGWKLVRRQLVSEQVPDYPSPAVCHLSTTPLAEEATAAAGNNSPTAGFLAFTGRTTHPVEMPQGQNDSRLPVDSREAALLELDRRFRLPLRAYFGRRISNAAEAEDLVQDVFERVLKCLETRPIRNAEALLFRIAINLLRDRSRRVRRHGAEELLPDDAAGLCPDPFVVALSPERVVLGERALEDVLRALDELDDRTRSMFYLHRLENLKIREIAELYGITPSAVEKQVAKALGHLARRLYGHD